MDSTTLAEFKTQCEETALKVAQGQKVQGWELSNADFYSYDYYDYEDTTASSIGESSTKTTERISVGVRSVAKVHNESYASFHAYCRDGKCKISHIRFAKTKPSDRSIY